MQRLVVLCCAVAAVGLAGSLSLAAPAQAQSSARVAAPAGSFEAVPAGMVDAALKEDEQSRRAVGAYLGERLPDRDGVVARGQSLLYEMQRRNAGPGALARVRAEARRNACAAIVVNTGFDRDYVPPRGTLAFDLQPANGVAAGGFIAIAPGDQRVAAARGVLRNPGEPVVGDSLLGITAFQTSLANGRYRVILLTDRLGEMAARAPFGQSIDANGMRIVVADLPPPRWLTQGYLTSKAVAPALASAAPAGQGGVAMLRPGDLLADQAGAIEFQVDVTDGMLRLGFAPSASLAAVIVEPMLVRSSLQLVGAARGGPSQISECLDQDETIGRDIPRGTPYLGAPGQSVPGGGGGSDGSAN